jgi:hypothetical protein
MAPVFLQGLTVALIVYKHDQAGAHGGATNDLA